jgi:WD40 repeat protein
LDYNPNKPHQLATGGDDCAIKFWDLRNTNAPILEHSNLHSHWVYQVQYNRFHDQLVLSSGSDNSVALSSISSVSSLPIGSTTEDHNEVGKSAPPSPSPGFPPTKPALEDGALLHYENHEDAVYSLAWSNSDPWTFCSASYDGRVLISVVPNPIKYKIILE